MKKKIIKAFLTVISFLLISEIFFVVTHFIVTDKYQRITDNMVSEYQLSKDTTDVVNSFYDLIQYSNDRERVLAFQGNLSKLQTLLGKLDKSLADGASWTVYLGVKNTINLVISEVNSGVENISAGNFSEVTSYYLKAAQDNNFVRENTGTLLLKELESVETAQADIKKTKFWSEMVGLILCLAAVLGSFLYARFCANKMVEPMQRLTESIKKIGEGNYDENIKIGSDEMADLDKSLAVIASLLKDNAKKIKTKEAQLNESQKYIARNMPKNIASNEDDKTKIGW